MRATTLGYSSKPSRLAALVGASTVVAAGMVLVGCSSTATPPGGSPSGSSSTKSSSSATSSGTAEPTSSNGPTMSTSVEVGDTMVYAYMSQTATISCPDGKSLNVTGSDNTLTVTGTCETLSVGGKGNKITLDKVNTRITVLGMDNTITYKDGDPKVNKIGPNNTVTKGG
jgi:hypothetical protein